MFHVFNDVCCWCCLGQVATEITAGFTCFNQSDWVLVSSAHSISEQSCRCCPLVMIYTESCFNQTITVSSEKTDVTGSQLHMKMRWWKIWNINKWWPKLRPLSHLSSWRRSLSILLRFFSSSNYKLDLCVLCGRTQLLPSERDIEILCKSFSIKLLRWKMSPIKCNNTSTSSLKNALSYFNSNGNVRPGDFYEAISMLITHNTWGDGCWTPPGRFRGK